MTKHNSSLVRTLLHPERNHPGMLGRRLRYATALSGLTPLYCVFRRTDTLRFFGVCALSDAVLLAFALLTRAVNTYTTCQVKKMAMTGDMSVVSREYERSIINAWKNFVAGDIVRMVRREAESSTNSGAMSVDGSVHGLARSWWHSSL